MKYLLLICAALLLLSLADLPIGYYTFLRIIVTIGAVGVVVSEIENGIDFWIISFVIIAILFNPLIPIYLNDKSAWMPIDIIVAILFLIKLFTLNKTKKDEQFRLWWCPFVALLWIVTIVISIGSGIMAWNWIEPESFWEAIGFLILWGILSKVGHFLAMGLVALLGGMD